jgi:hypothetical protein
MQDSIEQQLRELERITSARPLPPDESDPEVLALHESWSRLSGLLAAADESWDADQFARTVRPPRTVAWARILALSAAVAATLALCTWSFWPAKSSLPSANSSATVAQAVPSSPPAATQSTEPARPNMTDAELAWDDTLDDRLSELSGALTVAGRSTLRSDSRLSDLDSRLQQIASEIEVNSL